MHRLIFCLLAALLLAPAYSQDPSEEEEEEDETEPPPPDGPPLVPMCELVTSYGYKCEEHLVTTKDGYKLDLYHLTCDAKPRGPVAILMHSLMSSSEVYVIKNQSIGYQLCDDGIDIWMPNVRGTIHGRKHETLNPNTDEKFWDISFTDMGMYDLPAVINYVKEKTKVNQVYYFSHSVGGAILLSMLNGSPEMADSIKEALLMAPVVYATKFQFMLKDGSTMYNMLLETLKGFDEKKLWEAFPRSDAEKTEHQIRCAELPEMAVGYCNMGFDELILAIGNFNRFPQFIFGDYKINHQMDANCIWYIISSETTKWISFKYDGLMTKPVVGEFLPSGTSKKHITHIAQSYVKGKISFYDYESEDENKKLYGAPTPPEIDIKKATVKINLFYCEADQLIAVQDIETLKGELPNPGIVYYIEDENFNHMDFLFPTSEEAEKQYNDLMVKVKEIIK